MTLEEKAKRIERYCESREDCIECLLDGKDEHTCYEKYVEYPEEVERNYNILFGDSEEPETPPDMIEHPEHYCYSKYEPKDVIRAWGLNFNLGSAVKYISRAGRKDDIVQDLKKAKQFIEFEIEAIEEERGKDAMSEVQQ